MIINKIVLFLFLLAITTTTAFANNTSYVLAARQMELFKTQDRVADMVANANTTSFKSEKDIYSELSVSIEPGKNIAFSDIKTSARDVSQGTLVVTGRLLDIALNGPGYFMIDTPRGIRFTRSGNLKINSEGALTTKDNYPLIGPGGGQVEFSENDVDITIRENGLVTVGPEERGQIGIFNFENEQLLQKEGNGIYRTDQNPFPEETSKISQGMLENSNVNSVTAMTDLIAVSRSIETVKKLQANFHDMQINAIRTLVKQ